MCVLVHLCVCVCVSVHLSMENKKQKAGAAWTFPSTDLVGLLPPGLS